MTVKIGNLMIKEVLLLSHHQPNSAFSRANTGMPGELSNYYQRT